MLESNKKNKQAEIINENSKNMNCEIDVQARVKIRAPSWGSTADAVRHENATGQLVGNKFHSIKAQNYSSALRKWIDKNPNASREDIRAAELVLRDLNNSLKGK